MDILALILACSLHPDDAFVRTMVDVQSGGNAYFVGDLATLKTTDNLTSADDALRVAENIARHGGRPAVGLLGIPLDWAGRFGRTPRDLFDGCTNLEVGSAMFSEYQDACSPERRHGRHMAMSPRRRAIARRRRLPIAAARACVLTRLARELGLHGTPAAILKRISMSPSQETPESPPHFSAIFGDGLDDAKGAAVDWSDPRLYLSAGAGDVVVTELPPPGPPPRRLPGLLARSAPPPLLPSPAGRALGP